MSYNTARRRGHNRDRNKLYAEDQAIHRWYRFVLSFPPHLVRDYLTEFDASPRKVVLDPFCGTGTTVVEAKKLGVPSIGVEANRIAAFASQVKTTWTADPKGLREHAEEVAAITNAALDSEGIADVPALLMHPNGTHPLRSLPDEAFRLLLKDSISPLPLHKTLVLLETIDRHKDERYHAHELLALAKALTTSVGNLHFGPEVGVGPAKLDAPVVEPWLSCVRAMAADLKEVQGSAAVPSEVHEGDSRRLLERVRPGSVDFVITSPPYPNEKDYTRTTRLESVLLGFIKTKADLRGLKQHLIRSNTRNVYQADTDDEWVKDHEEIQGIAARIDQRRIELGKTSGFERLYPRVTKLYFGGMARHLEQLKTALCPGARLAYVVGDQASYLRVMIRTGELLADIAKDLGYEHTKTDLFRTRLATATGEELNEEVVLLRWPGN